MLITDTLMLITDTYTDVDTDLILTLMLILMLITDTYADVDTDLTLIIKLMLVLV